VDRGGSDGSPPRDGVEAYDRLIGLLLGDLAVDGCITKGAAVADLTPSERDLWLRAFYAPEYRAELRRLAEWGVNGPVGDES